MAGDQVQSPMIVIESLNHAYVEKTPRIPRRTGSESFCVGPHWRCWGSGAPRQGVEAPTIPLSPYLAPHSSSVWLFLNFVLL